MLRYNFDRILKARGIGSAYTYLVKQGVHTRLASAVHQNKARQIRLQTIEKLCLLFRCTPNDLMEWIPDGNEIMEKDQPLKALLRTQNKVIDITRSLNSLPLDKLEEISQYIDEKVNEEEGE